MLMIAFSKFPRGAFSGCARYLGVLLQIKQHFWRNQPVGETVKLAELEVYRLTRFNQDLRPVFMSLFLLSKALLSVKN